ncbi:hypothetical protein C8F04DRAFT_1088119 [Mycena alexandri]|uniref:Uncharacterized protein n=1 Tax=Mycena alexandri TaxID=1745969 RepID=A0AAD6X859_9AGAR|nr:hypothetical protein C8F04DRAFT_1088119 [Mycena alexandri]
MSPSPVSTPLNPLRCSACTALLGLYLFELSVRSWAEYHVTGAPSFQLRATSVKAGMPHTVSGIYRWAMQPGFLPPYLLGTITITPIWLLMKMHGGLSIKGGAISETTSTQRQLPTSNSYQLTS